MKPLLFPKRARRAHQRSLARARSPRRSPPRRDAVRLAKGQSRLDGLPRGLKGQLCLTVLDENKRDFPRSSQPQDQAGSTRNKISFPTIFGQT